MQHAVDRRDRSERGAGNHRRRPRPDVDAALRAAGTRATLSRAAAPRTACSSSAARTTTPRWLTTTTRCGISSAARATRLSRFETKRRRPPVDRTSVGRSSGRRRSRSSTPTRTFITRRTGRADWAEVNAARFRAGDRIGITYHVASILGTWGFSSPTYFPSPHDVTLGNDAMLDLCAREPDRVRMFTTVNPNYTAHACAEIERCTSRGRDRHQAARQPPRRRSAPRPDRRARGRASAAGAAPHLAAPHARMAVARDL